MYLASLYRKVLVWDKAVSKPFPVPRCCESQDRLAYDAARLHMPHAGVRFARYFSLLLTFPLY